MAPNETFGRPRVYVMVSRGRNTMTRVLDLAYLGDQPIAVISWSVRHNKRVPGRYLKLDASLLRKAAPIGAFQYDGIAEESY